jgi:hypothetical protein
MVQASMSEFPVKRKKDTTNDNVVGHGEPEKKPSRKCINRETNSGHIVGNSVFYH